MTRYNQPYYDDDDDFDTPLVDDEVDTPPQGHLWPQPSPYLPTGRPGKPRHNNPPVVPYTWSPPMNDWSQDDVAYDNNVEYISQTDYEYADYPEPYYQPEPAPLNFDWRMGLILLLVTCVITLLSIGLWVTRGGSPALAPVAQVQQPQIAPAVVQPNGITISPVFMPSVQYWGPQIVTWAEQHQLDPNMVATVMQIESCGDPQAVSSAGARGLFQVMPFHFAAGEDSFDPNTNALRGMNYLAEGLKKFNGNTGLAFAGYNGGHTGASRAWENWPHETQRYYTWSTGIYAEATATATSSATLTKWLQAGGRHLCNQAEDRLGLP